MRGLRWFAVSLAMVCTVGLAAFGVGRAQDPAGEPDFEAYATKAGPEHAFFKAEVGRWKSEMKAWMDPSQEPLVSEGTEINRMVGDLWLVSDFRGDFAGQPFHGHGVNGYDQIKQKYVGTWVDSMSKHIMDMEGTYDAATKTLTMMGESYDPIQEKMVTTKLVTTQKSGDSRVMTMYMMPEGADGPSVKSMEVNYTLESRTPAKKGMNRKKAEKAEAKAP